MSGTAGIPVPQSGEEVNARTPVRPACKCGFPTAPSGTVVNVSHRYPVRVATQGDGLDGGELHGRRPRRRRGQDRGIGLVRPVGVAVGQRHVRREAAGRLGHPRRAPHLGDPGSNRRPHPPDGGRRRHLEPDALGLELRRAERQPQRRQRGAAPAGRRHDPLGVAGVDLVGEADGLHGQVQPLDRHQVQAGQAG
jgi:hypothetical protein